MYGGILEKDTKQLSKVVQIYECSTESWRELPTTGTAPPGLHGGATAYSDHILYLFGGLDDTSYGSLHQLDTRSMTWTELSPQQDSGPMSKYGCEMIYYNNSLLVIGGFCVLSGNLLSRFPYFRSLVKDHGITNEIHIYNISQGKYDHILSLYFVVEYRACNYIIMSADS